MYYSTNILDWLMYNTIEHSFGCVCCYWRCTNWILAGCVPAITWFVCNMKVIMISFSMLFWKFSVPICVWRVPLRPTGWLATQSDVSSCCFFAFNWLSFFLVAKWSLYWDHLESSDYITCRVLRVCEYMVQFVYGWPAHIGYQHIFLTSKRTLSSNIMWVKPYPDWTWTIACGISPPRESSE